MTLRSHDSGTPRAIIQSALEQYHARGAEFQQLLIEMKKMKSMVSNLQLQVATLVDERAVRLLLEEHQKTLREENAAFEFVDVSNSSGGYSHGEVSKLATVNLGQIVSKCDSLMVRKKWGLAASPEQRKEKMSNPSTTIGVSFQLTWMPLQSVLFGLMPIFSNESIVDVRSWDGGYFASVGAAICNSSGCAFGTNGIVFLPHGAVIDPPWDPVFPLGHLFNTVTVTIMMLERKKGVLITLVSLTNEKEGDRGKILHRTFCVTFAESCSGNVEGWAMVWYLHSQCEVRMLSS